MRNAPYLLAVSAGSATGYYLGSLSGSSGGDLVYEILMGGALGFLVVFAFDQKDYGSLLEAALGFLVTLSVDWIAGSPVDLRNKLSFAGMGSFTGWLFWPFWKQVLVGGLVGAIIGSVWGTLSSHWFGQVCLQPGILNAALLAVQVSMIGMCFGSSYMKFYGAQFLKDRSQA
jgi:hypothetical protein